jgi:hypothetical protein
MEGMLAHKSHPEKPKIYLGIAKIRSDVAHKLKTLKRKTDERVSSAAA